MQHVTLPPELKALLTAEMHAACTGLICRKNEKLFHIGQPPQWMFWVIAGEVILERTGLQGESVVLQRTRRGFVSEASLKVARYHCDATAIVETTAIRIPVRQLNHALSHDPAFANRWIAMLGDEVRRLRLHCERLSMKSVRDRLLHLIDTEGRQGRYSAPSGLKTLAGELGVTHEALYRTMATLEKAGVVSRHDAELVLVTRDA
jgi:CRP-like cAMP-binding protein